MVTEEVIVRLELTNWHGGDPGVLLGDSLESADRDRRGELGALFTGPGAAGVPEAVEGEGDGDQEELNQEDDEVHDQDEEQEGHEEPPGVAADLVVLAGEGAESRHVEAPRRRAVENHFKTTHLELEASRRSRKRGGGEEEGKRRRRKGGGKSKGGGMGGKGGKGGKSEGESWHEINFP